MMKEYEIVAKFLNGCAGAARPQTFFEEAELADTDSYVRAKHGVDFAKYRESLVKLKDMADLYDTILPSHGDIPMPMSQYDNIIGCVDAYLAGELTGVDAVGPEGSPCKEYTKNGFGLMV